MELHRAVVGVCTGIHSGFCLKPRPVLPVRPGLFVFGNVGWLYWLARVPQPQGQRAQRAPAISRSLSSAESRLIVGEPEANALEGSISVTSPIARAAWKRPASMNYEHFKLAPWPANGGRRR